MSNPQYLKLHEIALHRLNDLHSLDEVGLDHVATMIVNALWPEINGMINEAYRNGRTERLKGEFRAG